MASEQAQQRQLLAIIIVIHYQGNKLNKFNGSYQCSYLDPLALCLDFRRPQELLVGIRSRLCSTQCIANSSSETIVLKTDYLQLYTYIPGLTGRSGLAHSSFIEAIGESKTNSKQLTHCVASYMQQFILGGEKKSGILVYTCSHLD